MNCFLGFFYEGLDVCGGSAAGVDNKIAVEWSDLSPPNCEPFKAAVINKLSAGCAKGMIVLKNTACAWKFEVTLVYPFCDVFFTVSGDAVVLLFGGFCQAEAYLCYVSAPRRSAPP